MLPTTGNTLNSNKKEYERRNNINNVKNNDRRSETIIKGLLGSNEYYKTGSSGLMEKESDNRLGGTKTLFTGYTTNYRPQDPRKGVKPYDSIWELFKQ